MSGPAVEAVDLGKRYGRTVALAGLGFTAERGAVTALLGPNGAGKTTSVEICEGFRRPDAGHVRVLGLDPVRERRRLLPRIGVMLQRGGWYPGARTAEMLSLAASFAARPVDPAALLDRLGLSGVARTPCRRLSGGEQQRLGLAMAVVGRPELVFLDEPTAGLDPQARHATWELVGELRAGGVTVLLTTHYLEEAERLADHVVIIDHGRVVAAAAPGELTAAARVLRFEAAPGLDLAGLAGTLPPGLEVTETEPGGYTVTGPVDAATVAAVTAWCADRGVLVTAVHVGARSLEEVFLDLTGRGLRG